MYLDDKLVDSAAKIVVAMYGAASGASCLRGIRLCGVHSLDAEQTALVRVCCCDRVNVKGSVVSVGISMVLSTKPMSPARVRNNGRSIQ